MLLDPKGPAATLDSEIQLLRDKGLFDGPATEEERRTESERSRNARENLKNLAAWWETTGAPNKVEDKPKVDDASTHGGRMALKWTAIVPAGMAAGYLLLFLYFAATGGYKQQHLHGPKEKGEEYTGGAEGPMQA